MMQDLLRILVCDSGEDFKLYWKQLMNDLGLESSLPKIGLDNKESIDLVVQNVNAERLGNHPIKINKNDLYNVFTED